MIKNKVALEVAKENRIYQFICESGSNIGEIYDVMNEMRNKIIQIIQEQQAKEQPASESSAEKTQ